MVKKEGGGERYDQLRKSKSFYEPSEQPRYSLCLDNRAAVLDLKNREIKIFVPAKVTTTVVVTLLVQNLATCQLCAASVAEQDFCFFTASCISRQS